MNVDELASRSLQSFERELAAVLEQIAMLDRRRSTLQRRAVALQRAGDAVRGLLNEEVNGHAVLEDGDAYPVLVRPHTNGDKVLAILRTEPGRSWSLREILEEVTRRGWLNPGVRHQLETMRFTANSLAARNPAVERAGPAAYRYVGHSQPDTEASATRLRSKKKTPEGGSP